MGQESKNEEHQSAVAAICNEISGKFHILFQPSHNYLIYRLVIWICSNRIQHSYEIFQLKNAC